jgi:hypothetical protein
MTYGAGRGGESRGREDEGGEDEGGKDGGQKEPSPENTSTFSIISILTTYYQYSDHKLRTASRTHQMAACGGRGGRRGAWP